MPNQSAKSDLKLSFDNTEIAFESLSDKVLRNTYFLFRLMKNSTLVNFGSKLGLFAMKLRLPFAKTAIKKTIFTHFCGGETLMDCQKTIDNLNKFDTLSILDYGAENKTSDDDLDHVMNECLRCMELAASNTSVPVVSTKLTGLAPNELLEKLNQKEALDEYWLGVQAKFMARIDKICAKGEQLGVGVFIDAEESWMQDAIDDVVKEMMQQYNKKKVIVYNTYQIYRHDRLAILKRDHQDAIKNGYLLGAKYVRGAYMEKERARAEQEGYPSPIHATKADVDKDYNDTIRYCVEHYETIGSCCATHNMESNMLHAQLINDQGIQKNHPHLNFSQLMGMSDYITFNLAKAGFNVAKYIPYGPVGDVIPYLIRRANENSSVTGEMGRELSFIGKEMKRRRLL